MPAFRLRSFRRYALAFALVQGAVLALGPLAEARLARAAREAGVERGHDRHCVPLHLADHCAFCQIATARARKSDTAKLRAAGRELPAAAPPARAEPPARRPLTLLRSRAPPPLPA
jgi:hypothetical protein